MNSFRICQAFIWCIRFTAILIFRCKCNEGTASDRSNKIRDSEFQQFFKKHQGYFHLHLFFTSCEVSVFALPLASNNSTREVPLHRLILSKLAIVFSFIVKK